MVVTGRQKSIALFIALGAVLISVILVFYIGWVLFNWRSGILLFCGFLLVTMIICGVVLNTIFLVREIRRNEQHDAFINAVTHELKTPVASIRLYLETLQRHTLDETKRNQFYSIMLEDSERLLGTIEQVLRTGRIGHARHVANSSPIDLRQVVEECLARARTLHNLPADCLQYDSGPALKIRGDLDEVRAAVSNLIENAVKYSGNDVRVTVETAKMDDENVAVRVKDNGVGIPKSELKRIFKRFYRVPGPLAARLAGEVRRRGCAGARRCHPRGGSRGSLARPQLTGRNDSLLELRSDPLLAGEAGLPSGARGRDGRHPAPHDHHRSALPLRAASHIATPRGDGPNGVRHRASQDLRRRPAGRDSGRRDAAGRRRRLSRAARPRRRPDRRGWRDPSAVATRVFAGSARFGGERQVGGIMERCTGATGALS